MAASTTAPSVAAPSTTTAPTTTTTAPPKTTTTITVRGGGAVVVTTVAPTTVATTTTTSSTTTSTTVAPTTTTTLPPPTIRYTLSIDKPTEGYYALGPNAPQLAWTVSGAPTAFVHGPNVNEVKLTGNVKLCPIPTSASGICGAPPGKYTYVLDVKDATGKIIATRALTLQILPYIIP